MRCQSVAQKLKVDSDLKLKIGYFHRLRFILKDMFTSNMPVPERLR